MEPVESTAEAAPAQPQGHIVPSGALAATAKILEFPRLLQAPLQNLDTLADPVIDRPRILEAPEVITPPPALGGITLEGAAMPAPERRPGIDMPLSTAPLWRRITAALVDAAIVMLAAGVFIGIAHRIAGVKPPFSELLAVAVGVPSCLWAAYQYLFVVYAGTTIGLRILKLRLAEFDGALASRRKRRLRVLGALLSAGALGLGYAWQFLDEDSLAWHERVTRTYLTQDDPPAA
jgi:uncharacterized RDD family membrane protein YckC